MNSVPARGLSAAVWTRGQALGRGQRALALIGVGLAPLLSACATAPGGTAPGFTVTPGDLTGPGGVAMGTQMLVALTVLSIVPAFLIMVTSFTRIIIVLSFIRSAVGAPQVPPTPVLLGLALFLTAFIMAPTWKEVSAQAVQPYLEQRMDQDAALTQGLQPLRSFMFKQTREKDLALFLFLGQEARPRTPEDIPTYVLVPAFVISELKTAFQIGFVILLPFLIIDLVVSAILMSMGMMMLPPSMVSLPFKLLLFVLADGWHLVIKSLVLSFS